LEESILNNKRILITGGAGSAGTAFCLYLKKHNIKPEKIIIMSRDPLKHQVLRAKLGDMPCMVNYLIRDIRDKDGLMNAFENVDIVLHLAAIKYIVEGEYDTNEYTKTNVIGTQNVIEASRKCKVSKTLLISTDKATNAINAYGATKYLAEKHMVSANIGKEDLRFSVCRYGNVINSNGSIIPLYKGMIADGAKKLPITNIGMTRFFYPIYTAIEFIITCLETMQGAETFIPKIPSVRIIDIVKAFEMPYEITGIRPGEKLHECMIPPEQSHLTEDMGNYYIIKPSILFRDDLKYPGGKKVPDGFYYDSGTNKHFLTINEIKESIKSCN
jgi:UDP-N-acetylglucosamine 4,6-dehydratase